MLWQFQVDSKGIRPDIYMYPFSPTFPLEFLLVCTSYEFWKMYNDVNPAWK